jgi:hypothetical protein
MADAPQRSEARLDCWKNHVAQSLNQPFIDPGEYFDRAKSQNTW